MGPECGVALTTISAEGEGWEWGRVLIAINTKAFCLAQRAEGMQAADDRPVLGTACPAASCGDWASPATPPSAAAAARCPRHNARLRLT